MTPNPNPNPDSDPDPDPDPGPGPNPDPDPDPDPNQVNLANCSLNCTLMYRAELALKKALAQASFIYSV